MERRRGVGLEPRRRAGRPCQDGQRAHQVSRHDDFFRRGLHAEQLTQLLVVRLRPVQGRGELLHAAVLPLQPRHFSVEQLGSYGIPRDRSGEQEEQHHQHRDGSGRPLPHFERPQRHAILMGLELPIFMDDDGDAFLLHPSNGAPRISSSKRARSSFE